MAERLVGPVSLPDLLQRFPPKREVYTTTVQDRRGAQRVYTIESMISRTQGEAGRRGDLVYVVPGSTKYVGEAPPQIKSEGV